MQDVKFNKARKEIQARIVFSFLIPVSSQFSGFAQLLRPVDIHEFAVLFERSKTQHCIHFFLTNHALTIV